MTTPAFVLEVDWSGDGDFGDTDEDISDRVRGVQTTRGAEDASQIYARSVAGRLRATLFNTDGLLSFFKTTSAIYGSILPNRKVRLRSTAPTAAALWTGFLADLIPVVDRDSVPMAILDAVGPLALLGNPNAKISPPALENVYTGDVVNAILDAVGWPPGARTIAAGQVPIARWFVQNKGALEALQEMEEAEGGRIREGTNWDIIFEDRYFRVLNSGTPQATFSDAGSNFGYSAINQADPLKGIFNRFTAQVTPMTVNPIAVLWTLGTVPFTLAPGDSITYVAQYRATNGAYVEAWTTPVVGTDLIQTGVADGDIAVSAVKTALTMEITVTNNHATVTATISLLQARGTAVVKSDPFLTVAEDLTSQTDFGLRTWPFASPWYPNAAHAQAACDYGIFFYANPRPTLKYTVQSGKGDSYFAQCVSREISDRISVVADSPQTELGIGDDFFIESVAHELSVEQTLQTTFGVSWVGVELPNPFILDVSLLDGADVRMVSTLQVYRDADRWVVECPCKWAIRVDPGFVDFTCGAFPDGRVTRGGCGLQAKVIWPIEWRDILTVLAQRPRSSQRNWHPKEGDTLADLRIENAVLGVGSGL